MRKATERLRTTGTRDILLPIRIAVCRSVLLSGTCRLVTPGVWRRSSLCAALTCFGAGMCWCACINAASGRSFHGWTAIPHVVQGLIPGAEGCRQPRGASPTTIRFVWQLQPRDYFPQQNWVSCSSTPQYLFVSCTLYNSNQLVCRQNCETWLLASSCLSVCLSVRMQQLRSHWKNFHDI
jgi:hypothetical protein